MRVHRTLVLLPLAIALAAGCGPAVPSGPPTVEQASTYLDEIVALARAGDFQTLCTMTGDGNCARKLDDAGRERVPADPPTIVGARLVPETTSGDQISLGGLVLELCGTDALGEPYESEMLVFREGEHLRVINPAYWAGAGIAATGIRSPPSRRGASADRASSMRGAAGTGRNTVSCADDRGATVTEARRRMDDKFAMLMGVPLFVGLDDDELDAVGRLCTEVEVPAGQELMHEEGPGSEFFLILEGQVRIHRAGATLRTMGPGDFLGEIALIDHGKRTASGTCETDCRLLVLGRHDFHELLDQQPDIRVHVLEALARRVRQLTPEDAV
jgi:hypothetical protein